MKADLDRLMDERQLDALLTLPSEYYDPYRAYLANGASYSGIVIKKRGEAPLVIAQGMEVDEAGKSGLKVNNFEDFGYSELAREHGRDSDGMRTAWYTRMFDTLAIRGRVAVYGVGDVNAAFRTLRGLEEGLGEQITLVTEPVRHTVFDKAFETKDPDEIAILRDVAARSSAVMRATRDWIGSQRADGDTVVDADGAPLTIGAVKRYVRMKLFEYNLSDPEGMIFAQGRDAGVPHSKGEDNQPLKLGQTIVFDLFPRASNGYFHDMTRTWCIGHAAPEIQDVYDAVMLAYRQAAEACKPGVPTNQPQRLVCEIFEDLGHPTVLNSSGTAEGYVHSLAHGLGLNVHEAPYFPTFSEQYHLQPGNVFTIEPGLYYPSRGYGVRIEDTVYLNEAGAIETLTDCPYDLIIDLQS
jgi:Xaa-Pro aminopeptidase